MNFSNKLVKNAFFHNKLHGNKVSQAVLGISRPLWPFLAVGIKNFTFLCAQEESYDKLSIQKFEESTFFTVKTIGLNIPHDLKHKFITVFRHGQVGQ